ncbi:MAG: TonB-dependent receptor, partial [Pyrinomonadaceae bacterium]|nr:TonB-dependent receptor [Pyrinomonadaceae bacterium]
MYRKTILFLSIALLFLMSATHAFAQATGGSITGTVLDANGAAVANASVTLNNKATGQVLTTQTTEAGAYSFPNVPVGEYAMNIENVGFQTAMQNVRIVLNQESSVNVTLQAAGVAGGVVEVTASSEALVQTDSSQLARNYETRQVQDLPIFNDPRSLSLLAPNVVAQASGVSGDGGSVGGTRPRANTFNVDGVDNNDPSITGREVGIIQDAINEVSLLTNNYNAEYGTGAAGVFNIVTRSGTNEFHGSGFAYLQHQRLNSASTTEEFLIRNGDINEIPQTKDVRYGMTFGGPLIRNKLFFFGALQRNPISGEGAGITYSAPTQEGLARIAALPGASSYVVNLLRDNLVLPSIATTNVNVLGTPIPFGDASVVTPGGSQQNQYQLNIDHLPGTRDQFRYRYTQDFSTTLEPGNGNPQFANQVLLKNLLFSTTWVSTFSPSTVNELRLSYKRVLDDRPLLNQGFNDFSNITVTPLNLALGPNSDLPQGGFNNSYQIYDAINYVRGGHSFKFGVETRFLIFTSFFLPRGRGDYVYTDFNNLIRDEVPGDLALRGVGSSAFTGNQKKFYFFGQDDYKVTPNLTLNLGLRYEYLTIPRDANLQDLNAISSVPGVIDFRRPRADRNNFSPRVGLAYSPQGNSRLGRLFFGDQGQSAIRSGFALTYYETFQNLYLLQLPPQFQQELDPETAGVGTPFLQSGGLPPRPIPPNTTADARSATGAFIGDPTEPYIMSFTLSYQRQLTPTTALELRYLGTRGRHLPIQTRLTGGTVNYNRLIIPTFFNSPSAAQLAGLPTLGSLGLNQVFDEEGSVIADRRFPRRLDEFGFTSNITFFEPGGNSQYDGGSISLTRRFSRGFAATAAYTFSKAIDDATNELNSSAVNPRRPEDFFNRNERGLSAIDSPHRFVTSFNYELPFFNRSGNGFLRNVLGGYSLNGIFQAQSGQVITPQSGIDSNRNRDTAGDRTIINPNGV